MARIARAEVFGADEIAVVHVMNRTVRQCFLMGEDPITNKNYDYRKRWIDALLQHYAQHFAIDLLAQAIMSNHFHLVLRSRPDVAEQWDDSEVARRWLMICPVRRDTNGAPMQPSKPELDMIRNDPDRLTTIRERLSDISWWMRLLSQKVAQRANREQGDTGKFWQARFQAVRLLDETAILACSAYVDLNPIRAAIAKTIENSEFTSAQKRAAELKQQHGSTQADSSTADSPAPTRLSAEHLAPVELRQDGRAGPLPNQQQTRCSNKGYLPMSTAEYLAFLDWTARQHRPDKPGSTPLSLAPIFQRLGITTDVWLGLTENFGKLFSAVAGQPKVVDKYESKVRKQRFHLRMAARELMASV